MWETDENGRIGDFTMNQDNSHQTMLYAKKVAMLLNISDRTLTRLLNDDESFRHRIGAKRVGGQWRFITARVQLFVETTSN
jgi:hypothetical protein